MRIGQSNSFLAKCSGISVSLLAAIVALLAPSFAADEFYKVRTSKTEFKYYDLGVHIPARGGRKPFPLARFVAAPGIGLPMEIDPKKGEHMYCNTQYYGLGGGAAPTGPGVPRGVDMNSEENYYFPWTTNFCEKRGRSGDLVCGTQYQEHMGQDCRPASPRSNPKYWVTAVDDGEVITFGSSGGVASVVIKNKDYIWTYLHMTNRQVSKGQQVKKGQRLGQVWNVMQGGTTIHLHIELRYKDKNGYRSLDPLPSMIAAYHRALGNDYVINPDGTLAFDARYEIRDGTTPDPVKPPALCSESASRPTLGTEAQFTFVSLWCHNGSVMGLVEDGNARKIVYYKPKSDGLADTVRSDPVLIEGTVDGGPGTGKARHYSSRCGNRQYDVTGTTAADNKSITLTGERDSFPGKTCSEVKRVSEKLEFAFVEAIGAKPTEPPAPEPAPVTPPQPPAPAPGPIAQPPAPPAPTPPEPPAPGPIIAEPAPVTPPPAPPPVVTPPVVTPPPAPGPIAQPAPQVPPPTVPPPVTPAPTPSPAPAPTPTPLPEKTSIWDSWVKPYIDWWKAK